MTTADPAAPRSALKKTLRHARNLTIGVVILGALLIGLVNVMAKPLSAPPEYDPDLRVQTATGKVRLGDLVDEGKVEQILRIGRQLAHDDPALAARVLYAVPEDHEDHADALRFIGWHVHTEAASDPKQGVAFVNEALAADPTNGNAWQDLARCYVRTLGL